jgi:hypothetical protein
MSEPRALERLGEGLIAWRMPVAVSAMLLTAIMAWFAAGVRLSTRLGDLLPYRHPFIEVHRRYADRFGGANQITIMIESRSGNVFTVATLGKIFRMTQELDRLPAVNHDLIDSIGHRTCRYLRQDGGVIMFPPVMWGPPKTPGDAEEIRKIVHYSENLHGILVSLDDRAALIHVSFHEDRIDYRQLFQAIDERIIRPFGDDETRIWVAGEPRLYGWIYQYNAEVYVIFAACIVLAWSLLWAYFHDWRGALRPTITAVTSAVWGLGMIRLMRFPIDPLALVIPFFATARALSHSVQMHERYYEEYRANGWRKEAAIVAAFSNLFVPTLAGIATDALGLLVMVLVPILMLQRIAIWASIWVASIALSELVLNPIVYFYLRAPDREQVLRRERGILQRLVNRASAFVVGSRARSVWIACWVVVTLLAASQWRHITVGDPTAASPLLRADSPYNVAHTRIQRIFGGVEPLIVIVEGRDIDSLHEPDVLETMEDFQRTVERDPNVGTSFSLADVVKTVHMVYFDLNPRFGVIPISRGEAASVIAFAFGGVSPSESGRYLNLAHSDAHVTFFCRNHQGDVVARIIQRCREFIAAHPSDKFRLRLASGLVGVTAAANEAVLKNELLMTVLGYGTIFLIVLFAYRSAVAAGLMILPLVLANLIANAYMGWRGIGLNLQTLPVITIGIGFGIDYALYVTSRVIEELPAAADLDSAVRRALETSGKALTLTVVCLALATLAWTFSDIRFNAEMGLLLAIWMIVSFLASVTLLPALLLVFRPRFLDASAGARRVKRPNVAETDSLDVSSPA